MKFTKPLFAPPPIARSRCTPPRRHCCPFPYFTRALASNTPELQRVCQDISSCPLLLAPYTTSVNFHFSSADTSFDSLGFIISIDPCNRGQFPLKEPLQPEYPF